MHEDAYKTPRCVYKYTGTDTEGEKINPFVFVRTGDNSDCNAAVSRFINTMDFKKIECIINNIPEVFGNISVMPEIQKRFYLELMKIRYNEFLSMKKMELQ